MFKNNDGWKTVYREDFASKESAQDIVNRLYPYKEFRTTLFRARLMKLRWFLGRIGRIIMYRYWELKEGNTTWFCVTKRFSLEKPQKGCK